MSDVNPFVLAQVPLFADLPPRDLAELAGDFRRRRFTKRETICREGDPGSTFYIVESGRVKIALGSPEGKEVVLTLLGPGDFFGEISLLDGKPRSADAVMTESGQLLLLERDDFIGFVKRSPEAALYLLATL